MHLDKERLTRVNEIIQGDIDAGTIPGAAVAIGIGNEVVHRFHAGYAEKWDGVVRPLQADTYFDLASLTKVTATLPSVLKLVDEGQIRLSDPVSRFLPEYGDGDKAAVSVRHLLTHTAGLPPFRQYYQQLADAGEILKAARNEPLEHEPGAQVIYSDIGFILLGEIVREVTGRRLDAFARKAVFAPLGMNDTGFCPTGVPRDKIAATEANGKDGRPKVGVVHDENADALGGVAGHAGLFSTLDDMIRYAQMWVGSEPSVLSVAVREMAVQCQTRTLSGRRGIGWVCRRDGYDHTGDLWPSSTVGHTGFTGTSIAFDRVSGLWMVLLTNAVHYGRTKHSSIRLRGRTHNAVAAAVMDWPLEKVSWAFM